MDAIFLGNIRTPPPFALAMPPQPLPSRHASRPIQIFPTIIGLLLPAMYKAALHSAPIPPVLS